MSVVSFMKASFQHLHPVIEICFVAKTGKSLNKKAIEDCEKTFRYASFNKKPCGLVFFTIKM